MNKNKLVKRLLCFILLGVLLATLPVTYVSAKPAQIDFGVNIDAGVARKIGKCAIFAQFNYGYAEALSDWVRGYHPAPYLRFGILLGNLMEKRWP